MTINKDSYEYIEGYYEGFLAALRMYAWWKDGKQYVGSGLRKLEWAERDALSDKHRRLSELDLKAFGVHNMKSKEGRDGVR